jgi:hypothetical protein
MSGSTWTWLGNTTAWAAASNWSLTDGDTGNPNNYPAPDDTVVLNSGLVQPLAITGSQTSGNAIDLSGGGVVDFANGSTLDSGSAVNGSHGTVDVAGVFTLLGSLGVVGSTGTLTVAIDGTLVSNGTSNDIGINDGQAGALNSGTLVVTGGTVEAEGIHINDGIAIVTTALDSTDEISITGGSVEVDLTTAGAPTLQFVTAAVGSTIKLDDPTSYEDGSLQGFAAGDTLDIGTNLIGTIIYSGDLGGFADLTVENSSGGTLFSAVLSGGDEPAFQAGTFVVGASGGTAGSFQVTQGSGDTLITEAGTTSPGPIVNAGGTVSYTAGGPAATLDGSLTVSDAESPTLTGATVALTSGLLAGDTLSVASANGISASYDASTGTLTLSGRASVADYQTELDAVTYTSSAADPTAGGTDDSRTVSWAVNDSTAMSTASTSSLSVTASVGIIGSGPAPGDFTGAGLSDILYEDTANGASGYVAYPAGSNQGTWVGYIVDTDYSVAAIGDFTGSSTSEILYRDDANGAEGYLVPAANGNPASWVGLPDTSSAYTVVGSGDFIGNGQDSVLFEDMSNGDLGYFTLGDSGPNTWQSLGTPSLLYSVVGVGDFNGDGTSDIMFRDNATGQEGYYAMPRGGGQATWVGLGTSSTAYSVVGIGNFTGDQAAQIMFRDNASGDFGYVTPANGSNVATWTDIGLSETAYTVVQVGDFTGNGLSDVLFRDNATGDIGYWTPPSGGGQATWTDLGMSSTAYSVIGSPSDGAPIHFVV